MLKSVTSVSGLHRAYTNQGELLIHCLAHGHLLNGGLDIVRQFPKAVGNKKYLLVGTHYFTKWVEAEPLANI